MKGIIIKMDLKPIEADTQPLRKRLLWFVGLWMASVAALAIVGGIIRFWLK